MTPAALRIALLGSSGTDLLVEPLRDAFAARNLPVEIWTAGFGQYRQAVLDSGSPLYAHDPAAVLLLLDGADLFAEILANPLAHTAASRAASVAEHTGILEMLVDRLHASLPRALIVLNTIYVPPTALFDLEYNSEHGVSDLADAYNAALRRLAARSRPVRIIDAAHDAAAIGYQRWSDPRLWYLARSRVGRTGAQALARHYAAAVASERGRMRKCLILDLDNTLWGGLAGEEGPHGVQLGNEGLGLAFQEFQQHLLQLHRQGTLLALSSKNNPADAWAVIRGNRAMILREEHFAAVRIDWNDKAENIRALAEELNLGLDACAFIDDNPAEREWIRQALPEVAVPDWPADPALFPAALLEFASQELDRMVLTSEDRARGSQYAAEVQRRASATRAASIEDFYATLGMQVRVGEAGPSTLPRIAQLVQKTNQFNLTTRRASEAEIAAFASRPQSLVLWLAAADRFGEHGIVGVLMLQGDASNEWTIDNFVLSCRVLGRTIEQAFLAAAVQMLRHRAAQRLVGTYVATPKNVVVADLYARLGFRGTAAGPWVLDLQSQDVAVPAWIQLTWENGVLDAR